MLKITDFSSGPRKHLNYIDAVYSEDLCANVIVQVGFGIGPLGIANGNNDSQIFMLPQGTMENAFLFTRATIEARLNFDWFKLNYVCQEQPWICRTFPGNYSDF